VNLGFQHHTERIDQQEVSLPPCCQALRPVVAAFRSSHRGRLNELAVDHDRARIPVAPFRLAPALPAADRAPS
jgi:hypothetical protein